METFLHPNVEGFERDPFGYSAMAWQKWGAVAAKNGHYIDISKAPTEHDLKNPILWLSHARALSTAAVCLVRNDPPLEDHPAELRTICHTQYYAVMLMLVGYSLEVCLKAMLLIKIGADAYIAQERKTHHHNLNDLSSFIPDLSEKDRAILKGLTHFVTWAGRYPDPGSKRIAAAEDIFTISETYQISGKDLFHLSSRVMQHTAKIIGYAANNSFKPNLLRGPAYAVTCTTPPYRYAGRLNSGVRWQPSIFRGNHATSCNWNTNFNSCSFVLGKSRG